MTWPAIAEHHDYIVAQVKAGVRMSTIHQRLRDERGLAASVASFRRYVVANIPEEIRRSQVGDGLVAMTGIRRWVRKVFKALGSGARQPADLA